MCVMCDHLLSTSGMFLGNGSHALHCGHAGQSLFEDLQPLTVVPASLFDAVDRPDGRAGPRPASLLLGQYAVGSSRPLAHLQVDGGSVDGERWLWVGTMDAALRSTGRKNSYGWAVPVYERFGLLEECVVACERFSAPEERHCGLSLLFIAPGFAGIPQEMHDRGIAGGVFRNDCQQLQEAGPASPPILVRVPRAQHAHVGCFSVFVWNHLLYPPFSGYAVLSTVNSPRRRPAWRRELWGYHRQLFRRISRNFV